MTRTEDKEDAHGRIGRQYPNWLQYTALLVCIAIIYIWNTEWQINQIIRTIVVSLLLCSIIENQSSIRLSFYSISFICNTAIITSLLFHFLIHRFVQFHSIVLVQDSDQDWSSSLRRTVSKHLSCAIAKNINMVPFGESVVLNYEFDCCSHFIPFQFPCLPLACLLSGFFPTN